MDAMTCRCLIAREVEMSGGRREWVHGFVCGKPSLVHRSGQGVCADHVTVTWPCPAPLRAGQDGTR
ncbi:hypothetical protein GCM10019016_017470 [Streptomyces prasinosporus]|uniref:Uncharacterized protein n=1 Tax=Streptomyces prasinosporus TaxID=68256 RepID=A0ABP6THE7_9ACTN